MDTHGHPENALEPIAGALSCPPRLTGVNSPSSVQVDTGTIRGFSARPKPGAAPSLYWRRHYAWVPHDDRRHPDHPVDLDPVRLRGGGILRRTWGLSQAGGRPLSAWLHRCSLTPISRCTLRASSNNRGSCAGASPASIST